MRNEDRSACASELEALVCSVKPLFKEANLLSLGHNRRFAISRSKSRDNGRPIKSRKDRS